MKWFQEFQGLIWFATVAVGAVVMVVDRVDNKGGTTKTELRAEIDSEMALRDKITDAKFEGLAKAQDAKFDAVNARLDRLKDAIENLNATLRNRGLKASAQESRPEYAGSRNL